ncbi:polyprenyl diphosphate synthase [Rhodobaculum claviforme]|uniref:Isoprenyl transferase n=1 Tax=Rhodobaculum claviforme TaxID=1549854 RepID=A0A934TM68_9RHOB|nr:polyprenyl diphosphate synthase [Rhodobaculum claviforme]MBK5927588.1 di-trans,poly-cis-decaprenylcistransferase [Rhodobaculum claviforme]
MGAHLAARDLNQAQGTHVAIIMDGNGRWALNRGRPRIFGHRLGAERAKAVAEACPALGVTHLTLYAFSTENWKRSTEEVVGLFSILARYIRREADRFHSEGVRVRFIGDRTALEAKLQLLMGWIEQRTDANRQLHLTIAVNYGGRNEILRAARTLAARVAEGDLALDDLNEATLAGALDTHDLPDPDLVIRTGGETRISNFLPWQSAYAEYEFCPTLWPDFTPAHLAEALERFRGRERRFGAVPA